MPKSSVNASLSSYDDIFSTEEQRQEEQREQVQQIPIDELYPFKDHPFKVLDDEAMQRTVRAAETSTTGKSIFQYDPKGKVAEAYKALTGVVIANAERQLKRVAERGR